LRLTALIFAFLFVAAPASAQEPASDPLALIKAIYAPYVSGTGNSEVDDIYSKRLQALLDADAATTPKGDAGTIDWDVFVNGNNWELSDLHIVVVEKSAVRAKVRASFKSFKKPQQIMFDLVFEDGRWFIDEVTSLQPGSRWTMSKILKHTPDAFPDENKEEKK